MTLDRLLEDQIVLLIATQVPTANVLADVGDSEAPLPKITVKARLEENTELRSVGVERILVEATSHVEIPAENWQTYTQAADDAIDTVLMSATAASDATTLDFVCVGHIQGEAEQSRDDRRVTRTRSAHYFARLN